MTLVSYSICDANFIILYVIFRRRDDHRFSNKQPPPLNIRLTKGSVHIVASREFVKFLLFSNASQMFREWVKEVDFPDETYFTSLNHNPHLGTPGAYLGKSQLDRRCSRCIFHKDAVLRGVIHHLLLWHWATCSFVQECKLSYNFLDITQNATTPSENIIVQGGLGSGLVVVKALM